jgi:hypothetical protein
MIALIVALAVPVVQTVIGRTGGFEMARSFWGALSQSSQAKPVTAEARAAPKPSARALAIRPSQGPLEAAPVSAFPVLAPPAPLFLR